MLLNKANSIGRTGTLLDTKMLIALYLNVISTDLGEVVAQFSDVAMPKQKKQLHQLNLVL